MLSFWNLINLRLSIKTENRIQRIWGSSFKLVNWLPGVQTLSENKYMPIMYSVKLYADVKKQIIAL